MTVINAQVTLVRLTEDWKHAGKPATILSTDMNKASVCHNLVIKKH